MPRWGPRVARAAPVAGALILAGCDPDIVIGDDPPEAGSSAFDFPWSTGFEDADPDYRAPQGFCYQSPGAGVVIEGSPPAAVHSGSMAAAFSIVAEGGGSPSQVRCVRQGPLPQSAYYGAWYYLPLPVTVPQTVPFPNLPLWNLFHFAGADAANGATSGLWDLSVASQPDGALRVYGYDFLRARTLPAVAAVDNVPIAKWVHFEVFWKRSDADAGEFAIYQDGTLAVDVAGIATDNTVWGQFYVGSLAYSLFPPNVTVYVDDVTIGSSL